MGPLITSCWDHDPERRLTMSACTSVLGQHVETAETTEGAERAQRPADRGSGAGLGVGVLPTLSQHLSHDPTYSPPSIEQAAGNSNTAKIGMDARLVDPTYSPPSIEQAAGNSNTAKIGMDARLDVDPTRSPPSIVCL